MWLVDLAVLAGAIYFGVRVAQRPRGREREYRAIAALPDAPVGRIVGTARAQGELLQAPLSGTPCVYYAVTVYFEASGRNASVIQIAMHASTSELRVEDGSGVAIVSPCDDVAPRGRHTFKETVWTHRLQPQHAQILHACFRPVPGDGQLTFCETAIADGDPVAVIGFGVRVELAPGAPAIRIERVPHMPVEIATTRAWLRRRPLGWLG